MWWCGPGPLTHCAAQLTRLCAVQGLLLDLDAATLTVWVNGERKGVMVRPGMTTDDSSDSSDDEDGAPVGRLEGPLRWAVDVMADVSVAISGPSPPP